VPFAGSAGTTLVCPDASGGAVAAGIDETAVPAAPGEAVGVAPGAAVPDPAPPAGEGFADPLGLFGAAPIVAPPELHAEHANASMPAQKKILNERTNAKDPGKLQEMARGKVAFRFAFAGTCLRRPICFDFCPAKWESLLLQPWAGRRTSALLEVLR